MLEIVNLRQVSKVLRDSGPAFSSSILFLVTWPHIFRTFIPLILWGSILEMQLKLENILLTVIDTHFFFCRLGGITKESL